MNIKQYLKNVWNDLKYDETGQYNLSTIIEQAKKRYTSPFAQPYTPVKEIKQTVSPTYAPVNPLQYVQQYIHPTYSTYTNPAGGTPVTPATSQIPALTAALGVSSGGGGLDYTPVETYGPATIGETGYNPATTQGYNVNLPTIDWSFNPTAEQRGGWQTQATATAAQEIDPQLRAIAAALSQYMTQGQNQRAELNPRYTNQSLAIANIIKNTVKQEYIDNAIRRNATQSGWLPEMLGNAGQLETEQRGGVEAQRNQDLNALATLEAQQTQAAGEQGTMLEGLRGQRITGALADLINQAQAQDLATKQGQWSSALGGEQLRASAYGENAANQLAGYQKQAAVGMSAADRALQAAIAESEQRNTEWQQNYTTSQDAYSRALDAARTAQAGVKKTPLGYVQGIPYYSTSELQDLYQIYGLGGYATTPEAKETTSWQDKYNLAMDMYAATKNEMYLKRAQEIANEQLVSTQQGVTSSNYDMYGRYIK